MSASTPVLAGLVAFKVLKYGPTDKYVTYPKRESRNTKKVLYASGKSVISVYARFYVEPSQEHEGLVHIKCCYNNKYWVPRQVDAVWYIYCDAKDPQEEQSEPSCTLFSFDREDGILRYMDQAGSTKLVTIPDNAKGWLSLVPETSPLVTVFKAIDLAEEVALPTHVRFMGDNNKYLGTYPDRGTNYLAFQSDDYRADNVTQTIHTNDDGTIRIKANNVGLFWTCRSADSLLVANGDDNSCDDPNTWFQVVKLADNVIALRNVGTNKILKRFDNLVKDSIAALDDSVSKWAELRLEAAIISREIYDVQYDFSEVSVYDQSDDITMANVHAVNFSSVTNTTKINLKYSMVEQSSWTTSTNKEWGVQASVDLSVPKIIAWTGLDVKFHVQGHYKQAKTEGNVVSRTVTHELSDDYTLTVPPNTKVTISAVGRKASCNIPYSYCQKDVLTNGMPFVQKFDDGMYYGVNYYDFTYKVTEQKLLDNTELDDEVHAD